MKSIFVIAMTLSLGACSLLAPKPEPKPVVREEFFACPAHELCHANWTGGICMPSGEHHSVAEKCDVVK